jgi:hypothetical protein
VIALQCQGALLLKTLLLMKNPGPVNRAGAEA